MTATEHFRADQLPEAIAVASARLKSNPREMSVRWFLSELLCFAGELDRADNQLDTLATQNDDMKLAASLFRQLIRAEQARRQFYAEGRVPEVIESPATDMRLRLEATVLLRVGEKEKAAALLLEAEKSRSKNPGVAGDVPFADFRDLDDLTSAVFEILTPNGKFYWIPIHRLQHVEFHPCKRARDLLWRPAHAEIESGPSGEVFFPTLYYGSSTAADPLIRLGRKTEWIGTGEEPVRGLGLRTYLVGDNAATVLELTTLEFKREPV
jgi:type VI secretion system protein ImpE